VTGHSPDTAVASFSEAARAMMEGRTARAARPVAGEARPVLGAGDRAVRPVRRGVAASMGLDAVMEGETDEWGVCAAPSATVIFARTRAPCVP